MWFIWVQKGEILNWTCYKDMVQFPPGVAPILYRNFRHTIWYMEWYNPFWWNTRGTRKTSNKWEFPTNKQTVYKMLFCLTGNKNVCLVYIVNKFLIYMWIICIYCVYIHQYMYICTIYTDISVNINEYIHNYLFFSKF